MAMDFFTAQDQARQATRRLVLVFMVLVTALVGLTCVLVTFVFFLGTGRRDDTAKLDFVSYFLGHLDTSLVTALVVVSGIAVAMLLRKAQLAEGGHVIARLVGGERISAGLGNSEELLSRYPISRERLVRALNVVEEMAIASGVPVPPVYLIPGDGINAFAAGYASHDAVIGLTVGAIQQLDRDELQGVVAHEFSHILNGDMRLNIRLMVMMFGLTCIAEVGRFLLRHGRSSSSRDSNAFALLGLGLLVIGYTGVFFASLLRAAVSRQREFLADASAVQFTRSNEGIAGALFKIGSLGSRLKIAEHDDVRHFFFSDASLSQFNGHFGWWDSHPPLEQRIAVLVPAWRTGQPLPFQRRQRSDDSAETPTRDSATTSSLPQGLVAAVMAVSSETQSTQPLWQDAMLRRLDALLSLQSGAADPSKLRASSDVLSAQINGLSEYSKQLLHKADGAEALVYACVLNDQHLAEQLQSLQQDLKPQVWQALDHWVTATGGMSLLVKLMLLQLTAPLIREFGGTRRAMLSHRVQHLILQDQQVDFSEALVWLWLGQLLLERPKAQKQVELSLAQASDAVAQLLVVVGQLSQLDHATVQQLTAPYLQEVSPLAIHKAVEPYQLTNRLPELLRLDIAAKQALWQAMLAITLHDERLDVHELSLLHLYALLFDVPLQPQHSRVG